MKHTDWSQYFRYEDGKIFWTVSTAQTTKVGGRAGYNTQRYRYVCLHNKRVVEHRVIYELFNGPQDWSRFEIDHIDGDGFNNQIENLRLATRSDNTRNVGPRKDNKSGFKGVSWDKACKSWIAQTTINKKRVRLGRFDTPEEAARAYDRKSKELHGEFAYQNF